MHKLALHGASRTHDIRLGHDMRNGFTAGRWRLFGRVACIFGDEPALKESLAAELGCESVVVYTY